MGRPEDSGKFSVLWYPCFLLTHPILALTAEGG